MDDKVMKFEGSSEERMTSLEIAELTGKSHSHLMRDIRNMEPAWEKISQSKFGLTSYVDIQGKERPCYSLTKTECLYVATKFNDEARAKLVLRWEELEKNTHTTTTMLPDFTDPAVAARAWAEQFEQRVLATKRAREAETEVCALSQEILEMQPKVNYFDKILSSQSTVRTTQIALDYGMTAKSFNQLLNELHIQYKVSGQWILYAPYIGQGYMRTKPFEFRHKDGQMDVKCNSEWTQKGRLFLYEKLKEHDILPLMDR